MKNITLLDGAVGTSLWAKAEAMGIKKVPVWRYNLEKPEIVHELAKEYAEAGSKIILANTFGANRIAVKHSTKYEVKDLVKTAVEIAKDAIKGSGAKLSLAMGPLSEFMEPYGDLEEDEVFEIYDEMCNAGIKAGAEHITIQTFIDLEMMKVAAKVAKQYGVPVFCTMSFEKNGYTLMHNSVEDICNQLGEIGIDGIGMNCSLGPDLAVPIISQFKDKTNLPIVFKPNAGLPITASDGTVISNYTPEQFAKEIEPALDFVSYIGGCCGTDASYVRAIKKLIE